MRKLTRVLCIVLSVLMVAAMFAGCKKSTAGKDESTIEVTSVAPAKVVIEKADEYSIADGTSIVTVITDNETGTTTMKVATGTTLSAFLEVVKAAEGYSIKITDASSAEVTDTAALIEDGFTFAVYKDGEATAVISHPITVVSEEEIKEAISEAESEAARVESETAIQQSQIAANEQNAASGANSTISIIGPSGPNNSGDPGISKEDVISQTSSTTGGYTFSVRTHREINGSDEGNSLFRNRYADIGTELGYTMDVAQDAGTLTASTIANAVMSGNKYADLIETTIPVARALAKQGGILCSLNSTVDTSASYFSKGVVDANTFKGQTYAVSFTGQGTNPMGVTFNQEMIALYAPGYDIYDMYKKKTWTADAYTEIMKLCTKDLNGSPASYEVYGMTSNTNVIGIALSSFSGGTAAKDPSTGYIYPCFTTDAGIKSLQWCKNAYNNSYWKYIADIYSAINYFAAGSAATVVTYMWAVGYAAASVDFTMGFVPFPIGGSMTDYVTQTYDAACFIATTPNSENLDKVGNVLAKLSTINDSLISVGESGFRNNGLDDIGCSVYRWALTNMTADYSTGVEWGSISATIDTSVTNPSKEPASEMNKIATQATNACNDYYGSLTGQN